MDKKTIKVFAIFWLISGIIWTTVTVRYVMAGDDMAGATIYIITAVISFVLAFVYDRILKK